MDSGLRKIFLEQLRWDLRDIEEQPSIVFALGGPREFAGSRAAWFGEARRWLEGHLFRLRYDHPRPRWQPFGPWSYEMRQITKEVALLLSPHTNRGRQVDG